MSSTSILVKEKADLDKVIQKLATLHKAFEILSELTAGNKKQYELLKNKISGLEKMCEHLAQSKLLAMTLSVIKKDKLTKLAKLFGIFQDKFSLGPLSILLDNLSFRKNLLQDNFTAMKAAIGKQYDVYSTAYDKYLKETRQFKMSLATLNETLRDPTTYFDIIEMAQLVSATFRVMSDIGSIEREAIDQLNMLNSQVHALHLMVFNSSSTFKDSLLKARQALLDITDSAIKHYGSMSNGFLDFAEGVSTKVVWQDNALPVKSPLEYAEVLLASWKDTIPPESAQLVELMGEIKSRVDVSRESYIEIANYLDEQVSLISIELDTYYKPLVQDMTRLCMNLLKCLCWFPENHRSIRKKVGADNANSEFVRTFESSFKTKSIQIIDHLFFFFEIFQKNLTETIIENLNVWGREYEIVTDNIINRFDDQKKSLAEQKKLLAQVKQIASQNSKADLTLANRSAIVDHIETVEIDMAKAILLITGETTKGVRFSFEFIEKTLNSLVKVFDALSSHSELTLGEETMPLEGESLEEAIKEYFNIEGDLSAVIFSKKAMSIQGQLIFDKNIDQAVIDKVIMQNLGGWLDYVAPYLHPLEEYHELLVQLNSLMSQSGSKNLLLSPEINHLVEMTDEDINMASIYKYSARITKSGLPCNGTLMLMSEFLVFFCKSLASTVNLLVPYRCIDDLKQVKNFMGTSNGLTIVTPKGAIDFFLQDKSVRDLIYTRLQTSIESLRIVTQSTLFQALCFRDQYLWPQGDGEPLPKLVTARRIESMRAHVWRSIRRVNIRYLDLKAPVAQVEMGESWIGDIERLMLDSRQFMFDGQKYESFIHLWAYVCGGGRLVDVSKTYETVKFRQQVPKKAPLSPGSTESKSAEDQESWEVTAFLEDNAPRTLVFEADLPEVGTINSRWSVYHSHLDLTEIVMVSTCAKRMNDFEGLLVISQGDLIDKDSNPQSVFARLYWKQGINPFQGATEMYGDSFMNLLRLVCQEKKKFDCNDSSKYSTTTSNNKEPEETDLLGA